MSQSLNIIYEHDRKSTLTVQKNALVVKKNANSKSRKEDINNEVGSEKQLVIGGSYIAPFKIELNETNCTTEHNKNKFNSLEFQINEKSVEHALFHSGVLAYPSKEIGMSTLY